MVQQGKADQVLASYPQAVQANPDDPVARHNLGQHLLGQLRYAEAEEEFRQALRLRPDYLAARDGLGKALARQGRHREAEAEYRRYLAQRKDATGRVGLRMALESQSRWPEVEAVLRETIRLHQNDSSSYRNLARALIKQDKLVEARGAFQQSIRLSARSRGGTTEAELGEVHARLGEWPEALAACTTSIDDLPTFPAHVNAAALYLHAGDRDGYRRVVARLLDRYGQGYARTSCEQTVLACLLLPGEVSGDRLARAADRLVVTGGIFDRMTAKSLVARALFDCRAKRYHEAAARLSKASAGESDPPLEATAAAVRTLIEAGRGDRGKAALALEQARGVLQLVPDPARGRPFGPDWLDWLQARILVAEAEGAVAGKDRAPPP
jgi:tetratricopeptide (TPR) repeat protein